MLTKDNLIALRNLLLLYFLWLMRQILFTSITVLLSKKFAITRITHFLIMLNAVSLRKSPLSRCVIFRFPFNLIAEPMKRKKREI